MKKNLLLIDDDNSIVEVVTIFLEEEGFNVKSYPNGKKIAEKILTTKPDIVLIDFLLPGKNGAEITVLIRKEYGILNLPIIMFAANKSYKKIAKAAGVNEFLEKPFDLNQLLYVLKRYTN